MSKFPLTLVKEANSFAQQNLQSSLGIIKLYSRYRAGCTCESGSFLVSEHTTYQEQSKFSNIFRPDNYNLTPLTIYIV